MATCAKAIDMGEWLRAGRRVRAASTSVFSSSALIDAFRNALDVTSSTEPNLAAAIRHLLNHPGRMVRAQLVYDGAHAYGLSEYSAVGLALGLELFHTASLAFDDLPCMDDATVRRGQPCVHVAYGQATAILAGLALINRAYALIWSAAASMPGGNQYRALKYLEQCLGVNGLLNGQSLDLNCSQSAPELAELIASGKTVSLIRLALVMPALLGGAGTREHQLLERLARYWGLSYQVLDDLKDVLADEAANGKSAGRDQLLGRPNMALAIGVTGAIDRVRRLMRAGHRTSEQLIAIRPELVFLCRLRVGLDFELAGIEEAARDRRGPVQA